MPKQLKDQRIKIVKVGYIINDWGDQIPGFETKAETWAYYRHLSGKEYWDAMAVNSKITCYFTFPDPRIDGLDTYYYIVHRNKVYDITDIDDYEGQPNHDIRCSCTYDENQTRKYLDFIKSQS